MYQQVASGPKLSGFRYNQPITSMATHFSGDTEVDKAMEALIQDSNGSGTYSNDRAMMGHLEAGLFMHVPKSMVDKAKGANNMKTDIKEFGSTYGAQKFMGKDAVAYRANNPYFNFYAPGSPSAEKGVDAMKMSIMNFKILTDAGKNDKCAYYLSGLRTRWAMTGGLTAMLSEEDTLSSEYVEVDADDDVFGNMLALESGREILNSTEDYVMKYVAVMKSNIEINHWVVKHAEALWAATEYVFRTRGHHYKSDDKGESGFDAVYNRYLTASFEGNFAWPDAITRAEVFHTAIHPFKIRALPVVTAHYLAYGKLSEAAKVRLLGSPCGHAVITTSVAALKTMKGEAWWSAFEKTFGEDVKKINGYADQINDNKYGYHQGAGLYGVEKADSFTNINSGKAVEVNAGKSDVKFIAAACQGLIQALITAKDNKLIPSFALSNAKALQKAAADAPLLTVRIETMITQSIEMAQDARDIPTLVNMLLPDVKEKLSETVT